MSQARCTPRALAAYIEGRGRSSRACKRVQPLERMTHKRSNQGSQHTPCSLEMQHHDICGGTCSHGAQRHAARRYTIFLPRHLRTPPWPSRPPTRVPSTPLPSSAAAQQPAPRAVASHRSAAAAARLIRSQADAHRRSAARMAHVQYSPLQETRSLPFCAARLARGTCAAGKCTSPTCIQRYRIRKPHLECEPSLPRHIQTVREQ
jgi:hypothetical protein